MWVERPTAWKYGLQRVSLCPSHLSPPTSPVRCRGVACLRGGVVSARWPQRVWPRGSSALPPACQRTAWGRWRSSGAAFHSARADVAVALADRTLAQLAETAAAIEALRGELREK